MVVSHTHRYVYVQVMKTASSAIARELCKSYGGEFILSKHASITNFRRQASKRERTYFSFAGVRNPLDVSVSRYLLRKSGRGRGSAANAAQTEFIERTGADFNAFFHEFVVKPRRRTHDVGVVPVDWQSQSFQSIDFIYHYETLQDDFGRLLSRLGIEQKRDLPMCNKTTRKAHFLSYYAPDTLHRACEVFRKYMERWGYSIPEEQETVSDTLSLYESPFGE